MQKEVAHLLTATYPVTCIFCWLFIHHFSKNHPSSIKTGLGSVSTKWGGEEGRTLGYWWQSFPTTTPPITTLQLSQHYQKRPGAPRWETRMCWSTKRRGIAMSCWSLTNNLVNTNSRSLWRPVLARPAELHARCRSRRLARSAAATCRQNPWHRQACSPQLVLTFPVSKLALEVKEIESQKRRFGAFLMGQFLTYSLLNSHMF